MSSLMEMNARLSADLYVSTSGSPHISPPKPHLSTDGLADLAGGALGAGSRNFLRTSLGGGGGVGGGLYSSGSGLPGSASKGAAAAGRAGAGSPGLSGNRAASPLRGQPAAQAHSTAANASAGPAAASDRQRLMDEIEALMSSLQTRPAGLS